MKIKASLHIHTKEDKKEGFFISYSIYDLIDHAKLLGFRVLALTTHKTFVYKEEYGKYAEEKGILLIPGIELDMHAPFLKRCHILVLNCEKDIEKVKTFSDLKKYKKKNPKIFIIAPHPNFDYFNSMGMRNLKKYIGLFDAIEHSWFFSTFLNFNRRAGRIAKKFKKPFIATADCHTLDFFNSDYITLDLKKMDADSVFKKLRERKFENVTKRKKFLKIIFYYLKEFIFKYYGLLLIVKIKNILEKDTNPVRSRDRFNGEKIKHEKIS